MKFFGSMTKMVFQYMLSLFLIIVCIVAPIAYCSYRLLSLIENQPVRYAVAVVIFIITCLIVSRVGRIIIRYFVTSEE